MSDVPDLRVKDLRPPELQLPEVTREDLARLVSGISLPEVDLPSADDLAKTVQGAAAAVLPRRRRRRRWPLVVGGLLVVGLGSRLVLGNEAARARLAGVVDAIRTRIQALTSPALDRHEREDAVAFPAAATASIEESRFTDNTTTDAKDYPPGLGSNNDDSLSEVRQPANPPAT
jgi:hypothetical protein